LIAGLLRRLRHRSGQNSRRGLERLVLLAPQLLLLLVLLMQQLLFRLGLLPLLL
jgi:hypothetical protein